LVEVLFVRGIAARFLLPCSAVDLLNSYDFLSIPPTVEIILS
jgi:hypothetical protein